MSNKRKSPLRPDSSPNTESRALGGGTSEHTALQMQFSAWYRKHAVGYDDHTHPDEMRVTATVLFRVASTNGLALGQPTAEVLDAVLGLVADDPATAELEGPALDVLLHYLEFLSESSLWADTEDEYLACIDLIASLLDAFEDDAQATEDDDE